MIQAAETPTRRRATIDGQTFALGEGHGRAELDQRFARFFGERVCIEDLVASYESGDLLVDALRIASLDPDRFETRASFADSSSDISGTFINVWIRNPTGRLSRSAQGSLTISGSRSRLALQLHADMAEFARRTELVDSLDVEARDVGRYAYRFMHGVEVDPETRAAIATRFAAAAERFGIEYEASALESLRSPRDIVDFVVLSRISDRWMEEVNAIIERQGYLFTVDQVVDVARRPGLTFLIDQPSYRMKLDVTDSLAYQQFRESVELGRSRKSLQRLNGVLGNPFSQLPRAVRSALITYRPFLFPKPRETNPVVDLGPGPAPQAPYSVEGFRAKDGVVVPCDNMDPPGTLLRDYREREVMQTCAAIERGAQLVSVTGLSGSGKTEIVIWNLERRLAGLGHRVVSLDAQQLIKRPDSQQLLAEIDSVMQPTVVVFDESLYIRGERKKVFVSFAVRFLRCAGQHIVFVGGGRHSPEAQRVIVEQELAELWESLTSAHVQLLPKPVNQHQAYRFLGYGRIEWASPEDKRALLRYTLERYPPYFIPLMSVRLHEHPAVTTVEAAQRLIDAELAPEEWTKYVGMVLSSAA